MCCLPEYYKGNRPEVAQFLPKQYAKVLEIGCGEGGFIANLRSPCELWGIEPSEVAAKNAAQKLHTVLNGLYEEVSDQLPNDYFDLVICNDVIEHMEDHDRFFESIKRKMTEDAYLVGSIPNVRYVGNLYALLVRKDWKYEDAWILDRTHLRFFTEKSLKRTFREHGFTIEDFQGINRAVTKATCMSHFAKNLFIMSVVWASFGLYRDIQFLEFGFRIKCPNSLATVIEH